MWLSWKGNGMRSQPMPGATVTTSPGAGAVVHGWSRVMRSSVPCVHGPNLIF